MSLTRDLKRFANLSAEKLDRVVKGSFISNGAQVDFKAPVDTSEYKSSWIGAVGSASDKTFAPGRDAVQGLRVMLSGFKVGQVFYYTNSTPQALPIEFGHSEQAPNGVVRLTARNWKKTVDEQIRINR